MRFEEDDQSVKEHNPLDTLAEVRFELSPEDLPRVLTEISLGTLRQELNGEIFLVGVSAAVLKLEVEGFKTQMGTKYGSLNALEVDLEELRRTAKKKGWNVAINAMLGTDSGSTNGGFSADRSSFTSSETEERTTLKYRGIRPLPNNSWQIEDWKSDGQAIESNVMSGQALCVLEPLSKTNRFHVSMRLICAPADVWVKSLPKKKSPTRINRERVIGCIAAKALSGSTEPGSKELESIEL